MKKLAVPLAYVRDLESPDDSRQRHARLALRGTEQRVIPGVYAGADEWRALSSRDQYLQRVRAVAVTRQFSPVVLSHASAAAVHGLPMLGQFPDAVHVTVGETSGGRSRGAVVKHGAVLSDADLVQVGGLLVTSIARTVIDIAATAEFMSAVVVADHALHADRWGKREPLTGMAELQAAYSRRMPVRAHARIRRVLAFASTQSDSPLESVSRVNMLAIGVPQPVLQQRFSDYQGLIGFSEFYWPEHKLVGEADGRSKYTDARYRNGRTLEEVLLDEKKRADRLRAIGLTVSRWGWDVGFSREALRRHLNAAGLPAGHTW